MSKLEHKVDFVLFVAVNRANPNGDPLNGNRPRTDYDGYGEISDVCIKRKIRNRMQDMGHSVFVQSADRADDGKKNLKERASELNKYKDPVEFAKAACEKWLDVRAFGQVFAYSGDDKKKSKKEENSEEKESKGVSIGVRGPVSIHCASSITPVEVISMQITKSVNGEAEDKKGSDTMGWKHFVDFGLYEIKGAINVQLAEKTGFSKEDAAVLKECLRTLFVNDASSARPEGSMEVVKLYWWEHNCKDGQYSSAVVHRSVRAELKAGIDIAKQASDYSIICNSLGNLEPEELAGV